MRAKSGTHGHHVAPWLGRLMFKSVVAAESKWTNEVPCSASPRRLLFAAIQQDSAVFVGVLEVVKKRQRLSRMAFETSYCTYTVGYYAN